MHFLFPEAWYLLPLVVIPLLINLQRYFNRQTVTIPSLFFLEKLLRKSRRREVRLWEILVESLFLLGLIFLLSRPVFSEPDLGHDRLLVLLDDSPSMRYHFIPNPNPFFESLKKMLEEKRYQQIDIALLSQLGRQEPFSFRVEEEIDRFYQLFPPYLSRDWSSEAVRDFFLDPEEQSRYRSYDFIIYSDNKANHFQELPEAPSFPLEVEIQDFLFGNFQELPETPSFPPLLNVIDLPPPPSLLKVEMEQENFFSKEDLEMGITVSSGQDADLFTVVWLEEEPVFRKQITPQEGTVSLSVRFPVTAGEDSVQRITVGLEKAGVVFQEITRVIYVYAPKTLAILPPEHSASGFFKTLFGYDLERGNLAITDPNSADTLLVADIGYIPPRIPQTPVLFFLHPEESTVLINQVLKKWEINDFSVKRKRNAGILDELETPFREGSVPVSASSLSIGNYFTFDFLTPPDFIAATIQKQPMIFRSGNHAVFNGISLEEMSQKIDPQHLVWVYELLFSFWGRKPVRFTYTTDSTNRSFLDKEEGKTDFYLADREEQEGSLITVTSPPLEEFTAARSENGWEQLSPQVVAFKTTKPEADPSLSLSLSNVSNPLQTRGLISLDWVSWAALLEILLLGAIAYIFLQRWRKSSVTHSDR